MISIRKDQWNNRDNWREWEIKGGDKKRGGWSSDLRLHAANAWVDP